VDCARFFAPTLLLLFAKNYSFPVAPIVPHYSGIIHFFLFAAIGTVRDGEVVTISPKLPLRLKYLLRRPFHYSANNIQVIEAMTLLPIITLPPMKSNNIFILTRLGFALR
jgi:hypothetical protein